MGKRVAEETAEEAAAAELAAKKAAKKARKAAAAAEAEAEQEAEAALAAKKAAKKAKKAAAAAAEAQAEEEDSEAAALAAKKAAKKAKKAAAAAAVQAEEDDPLAFAAKKAAKKAAKAAAAAEADGEEVAVVKPSLKCSSLGDTKSAAGGSLKVFIKGLPYSVDEAALRKDFAECGEITQLQMPMNEEGQPKGFAFITYSTQEGVDGAMKFDNTDYGGRYLQISLATGAGAGKSKEGKGNSKGKDGDWTCPSCGDNVFARNAACRKCGTVNPNGGGESSSRDHERTVFIRGLPWAVTEESLRKDFAECGEIETLRFPMNDEGRPKGIAFIKYTEQEGVDAALKFDEKDYGGRTINVLKSGDPSGMGKGKGKGKDGGKGKSKDDKGKGKKGKNKSTSTHVSIKTGSIVAGAFAEVKTFADSDDD